MPPQAYALVTLFAVASLVLGVVAMRFLARLGGPVHPAAALVPSAAAFGALYLIGHRLGLVLSPQVELFGFQVALLGDLAIGLAAALGAAALQAGAVRVLAGARG